MCLKNPQFLQFWEKPFRDPSVNPPFLRLFSCFREKCVLTASCSGMSRVDHTLTPPVPFIAHFSSEVCEEWHTISNLGNLCAKNFSFSFGGLRRSGTRFPIWAICVPKFFHFSGGIEEEWHTISNLGDLCAKNFSFFPSKISGGRAGLAHKTRKSRFVCQS